MSGKPEYQAQIDKLLTSRSLHTSDSLRKLLRYLANQSSKHPDTTPKEYQIATEVFGRHENFDPHLDSLVRVQAARLRAKLAEYYASEGLGDTVLVELPKGTYGLTFRERAPEAQNGQVPPTSAKATAAPVVEERPSRWIFVAGGFAIVLAVLLGVGIDRLLLRRSLESRVVASTKVLPVSIPTFWKGFLGTHEEPWVIFSNAPFVGRDRKSVV